MARMGRSRWGLVAALMLGAVASGCGSTREIRYGVSVICTEPTEPSDKPGIWFHHERESAMRPLPKPIARAVLTLYAVPPEGDPYQLGYTERTSEDGIGRLLGRAEIGKKDKLRLNAVKAGYRPEQRDFDPEQLRLADLAVVLAPEGTGTEARAVTASAEAQAPAPTGSASATVQTLEQKRRELLATIERLEALDVRLSETLPEDNPDRQRLREQIASLRALVKKLEAAQAGE